MSRSLGGRSFTMRPPMEMVPEVISSSPAIDLSAVDLPQPEGPTRTMNSPSEISRLSPSTARTPPGYTLSTWSSTICAIHCSVTRPLRPPRRPSLAGAYPLVVFALRSRAFVLRERNDRYQFVTITPPAAHATRARAARAGEPAGYRSRVEEINRIIISLLVRDGRMSFTQLTRRHALSVSSAPQSVRPPQA